MAAKAGVRRWRKWMIAGAVFVLVSLGIGPRVIDFFFDDAADAIADQLGSVEVNVTPLAADPTFNQAWAFAQEEALGPPPVLEQVVQDKIREHGVPVGGQTVQFIVESNRANDLTVIEMRARVLRTIPPPTGTVLLPRGGGGPEPQPIVKARFHVGGPDPRAYDGREPDDLLLGDRKLVLSRSDSMILEVIGIAVDCTCEWVVDIDVAIGGEVRTITVPDAAAPLRLAAPVPRFASAYAMPEQGAAVPAVDPRDACQGDCVANPLPWGG